MNEPHDLADLSAWVVTVQAAVDAIRAAGATSQTILLPGNDWTHAASMVSTSGPALLAVTDSAGAGKLVFDVHQYLDSDGSGTQSTCTTDNVDLVRRAISSDIVGRSWRADALACSLSSQMTSLNSWLASVDRQALVTETGVPNNADCITKLNAQLSFVKSSSNIAGFTAWSVRGRPPSPLAPSLRALTPRRFPHPRRPARSTRPTCSRSPPALTGPTTRSPLAPSSPTSRACQWLVLLFSPLPRPLLTRGLIPSSPQCRRPCRLRHQPTPPLSRGRGPPGDLPRVRHQASPALRARADLPGRARALDGCRRPLLKRPSTCPFSPLLDRLRPVVRERASAPRLGSSTLPSPPSSSPCVSR